jgi:hypothetical protein
MTASEKVTVAGDSFDEAGDVHLAGNRSPALRLSPKPLKSGV